jgi:hypothetical protein
MGGKTDTAAKGKEAALIKEPSSPPAAAALGAAEAKVATAPQNATQGKSGVRCGATMKTRAGKDIQ